MAKINWTKEDEKIIEEMYIDGKTNKEIFNSFYGKKGLEKLKQIESKIHKMGLSKKYDRDMMLSLKYIGKVYGNLKIIKYIGKDENFQRKYECMCLCEKHTMVERSLHELIKGKRDSCGCLTRNKTLCSKGISNTYDLDNYEFGLGKTNDGQEFIFDKEDYEKISKYTWYKNKNGYVLSNSYVDGKRKTVHMHRLVMDVDNEFVIDHINRNPSDNRKQNLRACTQNKNCINKSTRKNNKSGVVGVYYERSSGKWYAQISIEGKHMTLGAFDNKNDAINARRSAEEKYFGDFFDHDSINNGKDR